MYAHPPRHTHTHTHTTAEPNKFSYKSNVPTVLWMIREECFDSGRGEQLQQTGNVKDQGNMNVCFLFQEMEFSMINR